MGLFEVLHSGKRFRRKSWNENYPNLYYYIVGNSIKDEKGYEVSVYGDDLLADDWEIVEQKEEIK